MPKHEHATNESRAAAGIPYEGFLPDDIVPSSRGLADPVGVSVLLRRQQPREISVPPFSEHLVFINVGSTYRAAHRLDGRPVEVPFAAGATSLVPAGLASWYRWEAEDTKVLHVPLEPSFVGRVAEEAGVAGKPFELVAAFGSRDPKIERIGLSLKDELEAGGLAGGELYVESLANALAVHLLREHSSLGEKAKRKAAREPEGGLSARALKRATDHIGDGLSGGLSLAELAASANLSPHHFSRLFKRSTGLPPHQYVIAQRVEKAKALLIGTDLTVGEIARACGFSNQGHLNLHFKRAFGVSPGAFRRG